MDMNYFKITKVEKTVFGFASTVKVLVNGDWYSGEFSPITSTFKCWQFTPEFNTYLSACLNFGWSSGTYVGEAIEEFPF